MIQVFFQQKESKKEHKAPYIIVIKMNMISKQINIPTKNFQIYFNQSLNLTFKDTSPIPKIILVGMKN